MKFKLGSTTFTLARHQQTPHFWRVYTRVGYTRSNGVHFTIWGVNWLGFDLSGIQLRDSDTQHPECISGYLRSDVAANPSLVSLRASAAGGAET